jgi:hypothetical protein
MSDHGWKSMLARISRWLAAPVSVEFTTRGTRFGSRSVGEPPPEPPEAPPARREPLRFADPMSRPVTDRQRAREDEYTRLRDEILRLVHGDERPSHAD